VRFIGRVHPKPVDVQLKDRSAVLGKSETGRILEHLVA
jgi:hypothetical protein